MSQPPPTDLTVSWNPDHVATRIGDHVVVMALAQGKYVDLDEIASEVWRRIERPVEVGVLCAALAKEFDGDPVEIGHDVTAFLTELDALGLISYGVAAN